MAWVAGADRLTGDLITSAQWNNYLGATGSLEYLKGRFNWLGASVQVVAQSNKTSTIAYTDVDLTADTSATAAFAFLQLHMDLDSVNNGIATLSVRRNGDTPTYVPGIRGGAADDATTSRMPWSQLHECIVGLDAGQIFEYTLVITGTIQVDVYINLLGYIDG